MFSKAIAQYEKLSTLIIEIIMRKLYKLESGRQLTLMYAYEKRQNALIHKCYPISYGG